MSLARQAAMPPRPEPTFGAPRPLAALLEDQARQRPDQLAAIFPGQTLTYAGLRAQARALARGLIADGVAPGDHVGIMIPNHQDFLVAHFAVQYAGGVGILLNARFKSHELRHAVPLTEVRAILTTDAIDDHVNLAGVLTDAFPELASQSAIAPLSLGGAPTLRRMIRFGAPWGPALTPAQVADLADGQQAALEAEIDRRLAAQDPEAVAAVIFTSGTTANPKACMLSAASLQRAWRTYLRFVRFQPGEKIWDPMPLFHSGGIGLLTAMTEIGGVFMSTPHFKAEEVLGLIRAHRIEHLYPGFQTLAVPVLSLPDYSAQSCAFVQSMVCVGPAGMQLKLQRMLPPHAPIMNLFGMSESSGVLFLADPAADEDLRLNSAGIAPPGVDIRILDPDTGAVLPPGQRGEIQFRGGGAFLGYYNDPENTARTILPGGWVSTGDLGVLDANGWLQFQGRLKDMLKVGGENVAAAEVESFLSGHPAVKFVQVVGKPDDRMGELPVAFVERNAGAELTAAELIAYCEGKIARFKTPVEVRFVTEWPMSTTKVQKHRLKELL
ncbi:class I adenylate-forming enzyme family protein [Gemmobacter sp.]|uniref:class I adenylate-forming enzyme family protein n=1 Tax=Gemmobacter sp. TaxID=1898957 RepID=UPI002AFE411A|nr:class I adenylate-forming enzyme family protein [Gemmobacter sp.]